MPPCGAARLVDVGLVTAEEAVDNTCIVEDMVMDLIRMDENCDRIGTTEGHKGQKKSIYSIDGEDR